MVKLVAEALQPELRPRGFRVERRTGTFTRTFGDVVHEIRLAISSRPPALGDVGMLIEPLLVVRVPAWEGDAARRLALVDESAGEVPVAVGFESLATLAGVDAPAWTLPDQPDASTVRVTADRVRDAVISSGMPYLEAARSTAEILDAASSGERLLDDARLTLACGALLAGREELAGRLIEGVGTWRREHLARILGIDFARGEVSR